MEGGRARCHVGGAANPGEVICLQIFRKGIALQDSDSGGGKSSPEGRLFNLGSVRPTLFNFLAANSNSAQIFRYAPERVATAGRIKFQSATLSSRTAATLGQPSDTISFNIS